ncbi:ABC transporter ATP-binding protein [Chania multitudinisentens RB-25]|uniref:ABC transporter ATP-binding protein n=1 Tax=Chania multitudinisentens RB-25 TaxID=1441930 RepID=W0LCB5_9GAMM|nr:ABC transporter ATP-binding protein [Chania multitudinisentens]AHG21366.1 ABC transporter ATP-binding protein [Chania multitudinisentens RB-25]
MAAIEINQINLSFPAKQGQQQVLEDISLVLEQGEFVVLLGPSGCGKSTILNLIAGFTHPDSGKVHCQGKSIAAPGPDRGMVFQQANLFPWLTVRDNVSFGLRMQGAAPERVQAEVQKFLQLVGLQAFADHYPWQLSGGMKQRAAMARAWLPNPDVLLMDEPFGALDAQTRLMMQELLLSAWQQTGTTILFVTHDVEEALFLADRVLIMSAHPGRIVDEVRLPFGRQRDIETLVQAEGYSEIKQRILHRVRSEARRHLNN